MKQWFVVPIFVLFLNISSPASGADFQTGFAAYKSNDYAIALNEWKPLAESGHARAQYFLGLMHTDGLGIPKNHKEAVRLYHLAAENGHVRAQFKLGFMYALGEGLERDYEKAVKYYRLSAEQGHTRAQFSLGILYANGQGTPADFVQAHKWWNLAAAKGVQEAKNTRDIIESHKMTSIQIAEAKRLAQEWMTKHSQ